MTDKAKWLSLVVTLLTGLVVFVVFIIRLEGRVDKTDMQVSYNKETMNRLERDVKGRLDRIDSKLDRLINER